MLKKLLTTFPDKVDGQQAVANQKAKIIYDALEAHPSTYRIVPDKSVRSRMNICFRVRRGGVGSDAAEATAAAEKTFLDGAEKKLLLGLKGHRSVGGIRASNYNAVPMENVEKLAGYLVDFAEGR